MPHTTVPTAASPSPFSRIPAGALTHVPNPFTESGAPALLRFTPLPPSSPSYPALATYTVRGASYDLLVLPDAHPAANPLPTLIDIDTAQSVLDGRYTSFVLDPGTGAFYLHSTSAPPFDTMLAGLADLSPEIQRVLGAVGANQPMPDILDLVQRALDADAEPADPADSTTSHTPADALRGLLQSFARGDALPGTLTFTSDPAKINEAFERARARYAASLRSSDVQHKFNTALATARTTSAQLADAIATAAAGTLAAAQGTIRGREPDLTHIPSYTPRPVGNNPVTGAPYRRVREVRADIQRHIDEHTRIMMTTTDPEVRAAYRTNAAPPVPEILLAELDAIRLYNRTFRQVHRRGRAVETRTRIRWPFAEMPVGSEVIVADPLDAHRARCAAYTYAARTGYKMTILTRPEGGVIIHKRGKMPQTPDTPPE